MLGRRGGHREDEEEKEMMMTAMREREARRITDRKKDGDRWEPEKKLLPTIARGCRESLRIGNDHRHRELEFGMRLTIGVPMIELG